MTEAAVISSTPTPTPAPEAAPAVNGLSKVLESTPEGYAVAKANYIKEHGEQAWRSALDGNAPAPIATTEPSGKAPDAAPADAAKNGKAPDADAEGEPGEITINADGKAIDKATGRFVPHSAYLRIKGEAKEAKTQNDTLVRSVVALQEKLATLLEPQPDAKPAAQPEPIPDVNTDPFGVIAHMAKKLEQLESKLSKTTEETAAKLANQDMRDRFLSDAQRFAKAEPTFAAAYQHLMQNMIAEQELLGVSDPAERARTVTEAIRNTATRIMQSGKSPSEAIFAIAKARGFAPPAANQEADKTAKEAAARAEIERTNKLRSAGATMSGAGGVGDTDTVTVQKLASMTGEQYSAMRKQIIAKRGEAAWKTLIGG